MKIDGHYRNDAEGNTTYAGMVSRMDRDIGKLLAALKHQGVDEKTYQRFQFFHRDSFSFYVIV